MSLSIPYEIATWIIVGQGNLQFEFIDATPQIEMIFGPTGEKLKIVPQFKITQEMNPKLELTRLVYFTASLPRPKSMAMIRKKY